MTFFPFSYFFFLLVPIQISHYPENPSAINCYSGHILSFAKDLHLPDLPHCSISLINTWYFSPLIAFIVKNSSKIFLNLFIDDQN